MLGDLGKLIVAKGFKKLLKVKKLPDLVHCSRYSMNESFSYLHKPV